MVQNKISKLKLKLGIDLKDKSKDDLLEVYLDDARYLILGIINTEKIPILLDNVLIELSIIAYNRMGNEGINSYSEGGIAVSYEDKIPSHLMKQIIKFRKLPR